MGCRQQLFGVGAAPIVFEAAAKAVGVVLEHVGLGADLALAFFALAFPMPFGCRDDLGQSLL